MVGVIKKNMKKKVVKMRISWYRIIQTFSTVKITFHARHDQRMNVLLRWTGLEQLVFENFLDFLLFVFMQ